MKNAMKNNNSVWPIIIYDILVVIAFSLLALNFNKWWLVLFGLLFLITSSRTHHLVCDKCGKHSESTKDYNSAIDAAVSNGWLHRRIEGSTMWEDYCPNCRKEIER